MTVKKSNIEKDFAILDRFIKVYCYKKHGSNKDELCPGCQDLLDYARERLENCPHNPKPKCKDCKTHCYKPEYREKMRKIMRSSGIHFAKRGRLDWLIKYFM